MGTSIPTLKGQIPTQTFSVGKVVALRRVASGSPLELSREEAEQLIADARGGKLVSLFMDAVTYLQTKKPNRNYVRVRDGARASLAASGAGVPFLRDHQHYDTTARGGRVVESKVEPIEDGWQIAMTLELTAPWAVEDAVRGLIDRFSISYDPVGDFTCSICHEPVIQGWIAFYTDCDHSFGEEYDGEVCQLEVDGAVMIEVSAVSVPAVLGTDVASIRQAMSANRAPAAAPRSNSMLSKLITILSLAATATEQEVLSAVEGNHLKLAAKDQELALARQQLAAATTQLEASRTQQLSKDVEALIERGVAEGRFLFSRNDKGERVETAIEKSIRHMAKTASLEAATQYVDSITPVHPIGKNAVETKEVATAPAGGAKVELSAHQLAWCKKNNVDPEAYAKTLREEQAA